MQAPAADRGERPAREPEDVMRSARSSETIVSLGERPRMEQKRMQNSFGLVDVVVL